MRVLHKLMIGITFIISGLCSEAYCAGQVFTSTINSIWSQDSYWGANADFIRLDGVDSFSGCSSDEGFLTLRVKDDKKGDRNMAVALTAFSLSQPVTIYIDNNNKDSSGSCYLSWIKLSR